MANDTSDERARAREATLRKLGTLDARVLSRATPFVRTDDGVVTRLWPSEALGKLRLVRRAASVVVVTDGLSDPWDPSLHPSPPPWTFGLEVMVEVPLDTLEDASDEAIAESWIPTFLWAATDWVAMERFDLRARLEQHHVVTHAVPPFAGLDALVASNGWTGALVGIPLVGTKVGVHALLTRDVWLVPLKLLTRDEYEWAVGVPDAGRARRLAEAFLASKQRHLSWPTRPSIAPSL